MNQIQQLTYDCNVLSEQLMPRLDLMIMYTVNRDYLAITMQRIVETGLQNAWMKWINHAYLLTRRLSEKKRAIREDIIGSIKVELALGIVLGLGIKLATICFIIETIINFKDTSRVWPILSGWRVFITKTLKFISIVKGKFLDNFPWSELSKTVICLIILKVGIGRYLNNIYNWLHANRIILNGNKTKFIILGKESVVSNLNL